MTELQTNDANVLIVDDEEQFLDVLSQRLAARGMKVDAVTSGEEAFAKVKSGEAFDAVVLDLAMPGMGGIETLKRIKEQRPDVQIIMLTGHGTIHDGIEAMKLGAEDFLEKPVDLQVLLDKIATAKHKHLLLVEKDREDEIKDIVNAKGW
jgi:DNA-binding NtrC family response regulator